MRRVLDGACSLRALIAVAGAAAIVTPAVSVGTGAPASAVTAVPGYHGVPRPAPGTFAQCPLGARVSPTNAAVLECLVGNASQGTIDIGGLDTTFKGPGIVQGGINLTEATTPNWAQAANGQSYSAPAQLLSKPVLAAIGYPSGVKPPAQSQVYVETQQAGPIRFGTANGGLVTSIPLSFHLENPLLGARCYVGTDAQPVTLHLTTAASGSLTGQLGQIHGYYSGRVLQTIGTEVVDGLFSVPGATGCGSGGVWDAAIDTTNALPSPSGANQAILYGNFDIAEASWVAKNL